MNKKQTNKGLYILLGVLPFILAILGQLIAYFSSFAISILTSIGTDSTEVVDPGLRYFILYLFLLIIGGWWYASYSRRVQLENLGKPIENNKGKKKERKTSEDSDEESKASKASKKDDVEVDNIDDEEEEYESTFVKRIRDIIHPKKFILYVLVSIAAYVMITFFCNFLVSALPFLKNYHFDKGFLITKSSSALAIFSVVILSPIADEILFRGLTLNFLSKSMPSVAAIIIQALFFGLYHGSLMPILYATLLGIVLGFISRNEKSLVPCIVIHMLFNITAYAFVLV